tara:strand:+ start:19551 stop:19994 length:444 start_codon:yes stop_codon:yes gene_type:complete
MAANRHGRRLSILEDTTAARQVVRQAINAYAADLAVECRQCMPFDNSARQASKIHYCLMRWRGFELLGGMTKSVYIRDLSRKLIQQKMLDAASAMLIFDEFGRLDRWTRTNLTATVRQETLALRKFIDSKCGGHIPKARPLVLGECT